MLLAVIHSCALAQSAQAPEQRPSQPLYQVTIVSRTTKAINYGYLSAPTRIGFQGTPVASSANGSARVEPKRGATLLRLEFDDLPLPSRFGSQYLTYVVWAISPDGRAQNLGELILDGSDKGKLTTSTPLQTFAMIVTAEPYYSVSQPSDIVVLENVVTRDTVGAVQEVNATYELLPRKPYTFDKSANQSVPAGEPVSPEQYESIAALYQALNAIQIAHSEDADLYARDQMSRARELYEKARRYPTHLSKEIVSLAREATQIAEDSRAIAAKRAAARNAAGQSKTANEEQRGRESDRAPEGQRATQPEPRPAEPKPQAAAPSAPQPAPMAAAVHTEGTRARAGQPAEPAAEPQPPIAVDNAQFGRDDPQASENRRRILAALPRYFEVVDSPRGITISIPEHDAGSPMAQAYFSAVAAAVKPHQGLNFHVEAHSDTAGSEAATERNALLVRNGLISAGIAPNVVVANGYGNSRPRTSNATANGRAHNRRIEIVIAGDAIGSLATWDRSYTLQPNQQRR